jgi:hypothetical protein
MLSCFHDLAYHNRSVSESVFSNTCGWWGLSDKIKVVVYGIWYLGFLNFGYLEHYATDEVQTAMNFKYISWLLD